MANLRFDARSRVIWSVNLPQEARLLYIALDDMARDRGTWFIKQFDLGVRLGMGERQLRRQIAELEAAGLIRCDRTGRSSLFTLLWISSADRSFMTDQEDGRSVINDRSDRSNMAAQSSRFLNTSSTKNPGHRSTVCRCGNYHEGEEPRRCGVCSGYHDPMNAIEVEDPIEETRKLLAGYVAQAGLQWPEPDDEICLRTLNAAGDSLVVLFARLRSLLLDRRVAPRDSYAWFPKVVATGGSRRLA